MNALWFVSSTVLMLFDFNGFKLLRIPEPWIKAYDNVQNSGMGFIDKQTVN
jgi:hypothetical protein